MRYLLAFFLFISANVLFAQQKKVFDLIQDFGAKADDKTDNYNAFLKAAVTISKNGGGILNIPKGKYYIASYKIIGGAAKNNITDIIFGNCKGLVINGNNSTIRVNGKFIRKADFQKKGHKFNYAYANTVCPFFFSNCENVVLQDITLYGEVDKMQKEAGVVEGGNYGVAVLDIGKTDSSKNILLKNVVTHHFATDGIMICTNGKLIDVVNCNSYSNARQGLSVVKGSYIKCVNSSFDSTGINTGRYGSHAPAAGIDIENEFIPGTSLHDVSILKCNFRGNKGFQIVSTVRSTNINIDSCFISDGTKGYSYGLNGVGIYSLNSVISNSIIYGTIQVDIAGQKYAGDTPQVITNNIIYSGYSAFICANFSRPVSISNNIVIMLPKPQMNVFFPHIQSNNCTFYNNLVVVHPDRLTGKSGYVSLMQVNKKVENNFWLVNKSKAVVNKAKTGFYNIAFHNRSLVKNQFFPANDITGKVKFPGMKSLKQNQVDDLLSAALFSAYQQKKFDKKYLLQANEVKNQMREIINTVK